MSMVGGLDLHRGQITYDVLDVDSGEIWRGRLWQPDRQRFRRWLQDDLGPPFPGRSRPPPGGGGSSPRAGSHRRESSSGANVSASTSPSSISGHSGASGSTPCSITTA